MEEGQVEVKAQAKKPAGFKKPQPGKFPVKQRVTMEPTPGESGAFVHDMSVVQDMAKILASRFHTFEERFSSEPQNFPTFRSRVYRMMCMLMAKKLATALSDEQMTLYGGMLNKISRVTIQAPSALVQIIDLFGSIEMERNRFGMIGQAVVAFSYFARATQENPHQTLEDGVPREELIFVNTAWPGGKRMVLEYLFGIVNAWATASPSFGFNFGGGVVVRMSIPKLVGNAVGYSAFVAAVPKTPQVARALAGCVALEPLVDVAVLNGAQMTTLAEAGIEVVNWNSNAINEQTQAYSTLVESRVRSAFSSAANWVPVMAMKNRGSGGQLLKKGTEDIFYSPVMMAGEVLDLGWLAAGVDLYVDIPQRANKAIPPTTTWHGFVEFVEGMIKL